jgi:drug/metabolite transporter (DMT)-like permease
MKTDRIFNSPKPLKIARLSMHFCVLLWGFTAILGKLISVPALPLVFWRMSLAAIILLTLPRVWLSIRMCSPKLIAGLSGVGALIAFHWICFYGSVKLSNASVAVSCIAATPALTCIIEPIITKSHFSWRELVISLFVIPAIILIVGGTPEEMNLGVGIGLIAAFFGALFSSFNKKLIHKSSALVATTIEMAAGAITVLGVIFLTINLDINSSVLIAFSQSAKSTFEVLRISSQNDVIWLLILTIFCTILPFIIYMRALKHISAFGTNLVINLEPIYTILLAILIFNEQQVLSLGFYFGAAIMIGALFIHSRIN